MRKRRAGVGSHDCRGELALGNPPCAGVNPFFNPRLNKNLQTNITALRPSHPFETVQALELFNGFVDWQSFVPWWQAKKSSQRLFGGKLRTTDDFFVLFV